VLKLKPSWLTRCGQIKSTDTWMHKHIENAHLLNELSLLKIDCSDAPDEPEPDELYARHYSCKFPGVYRVKDLEWYTPVTRDPRATLLMAKPLRISGLAVPLYVIFRSDKNGQTCAHAHGVAVTRPMLEFAEQKLPMLEELVAAAFERKALDDKEIKKLRAIVKKGPNHPQYQEMIRLGKIGRT
jgi:hypothetical protein